MARASAQPRTATRRLRLRLVCLLAIVLSITVASSQENFKPPGTPHSAARPFLFKPQSHPSAGVEPRLRTWLSAVEQHRPGEGDADARLIWNWTPDQLADVVAAFQTDRTRSRLEKTRILKRAVVLHTDIATMEMVASATPDVASVYGTASLHFGVAMELVRFLSGQTPNDPFARVFARVWYRTTAAFLMSRYEIVSTPIFLERAVSRFRRDPDLLLMAGGVHELLASPRVQEATDLEGVDKCGSADANLIAAEGFYRRALKANPSLTEAQVRLGRVLGQQGRHEQALAQLRRALNENPPPTLRYFMHLFVGEEEEALNHRDAAREAYRRALELYPRAQSAYLALSRLERHGGNRSAAVDVVQRMLQLSPDDEGRLDPWREYYAAGQAQRVGQLLDEFREPFRRRQ